MSLKSAAVIKFLDLLCEGPINGIVPGGTGGLPKNIFFNETSLNGSFDSNLIDINYTSNLGGVNQPVPVIGESNGFGGDTDLANVIAFSPALEVGSNYNEDVDSNNEVTARRYQISATGSNTETRTITDATAEKVSFVFIIPRLFSTAREGLANGQLFNATVRWTIEITDSLGDTRGPESGEVGFGVTDFDYQVTGISTSEFVYQTPKIPLHGVGPWQVKVKKERLIRAMQNEDASSPLYRAITPDPTADVLIKAIYATNKNQGIGNNMQRSRAREAAFEVSFFDFIDTSIKTPLANSRGNRLLWSAINTYRSSRVNYKNTAVVATSINTEEFKSLPRRAYLVEGLKVKIFSNATPRADGSLSFVGDFDGQVSGDKFYTTCPVCCFIDLLTSSRYGTGDFIETENISYIDYYPLAKYANERIPSQEVKATYTQTGDDITVTHPASGARAAHGLSVGDEVTLRFMGTSNSAKTENANNKFIFKVTEVTSTAIFKVKAAASRSVGTAESVFSGKPEPRFACNMTIAGQEQAYTVLQNMASIFRGMTYWQSNTVTAAADHGQLNKITDGTGETPSVSVAPVNLYNNSNVLDGLFNYSYASIKTRPTVVKVRYNDPENFYRPNFVCVEDISMRDKYGYQVKEIIGFGCTSKSQATRLATWLLETEKTNNKVITFTTGLQGLMTFPGQVFAVADLMRQNTRFAGRVKSASTSQVILDSAITLPSVSAASITCILSTGIVETKSVNISVTTGTTSTISVSTDQFSSSPEAGSLFSITYTQSDGTKLQQQKFRCLSVADNGDATFTITGTEHNDSIYSVVDLSGTSIVDEPSDVTTFESAPSKVTNLQLKFFPIESSNNFSYICLASWKRGITGITRNFKVKATIGDAESTITDNGRKTQLEIKDVLPNTLVEVEVQALGQADTGDTVFSEKATASATAPSASTAQDPVGFTSGDVTISDANILPPNPTGFTVAMASFTSNVVAWDPPKGINTKDLVAEVRKALAPGAYATNFTPANAFNNSLIVVEKAAASGADVIPGGNGVYYLRFKNLTTGQVSATPASFTLNNDFNRKHVVAMQFDESADGSTTYTSGGGTAANPGSASTGTTQVATNPFAGFDLKQAVQRNVRRTNDLAAVITETNHLRLIDYSDSGEYFLSFDADVFDQINQGRTGRTSTMDVIVEPLIENKPIGVDGNLISTVNTTNVEVYVRASAGVQKKYLALDILDMYIERENNTEKLEMEDSSSGSKEIAVENTVPDFGDWTRITGRTEMRGRYFQAKLVLTTDDTSQSPGVSSARINFFITRRNDKKNAITTASSGFTAVSYDKRFYKFASATTNVNPSVMVKYTAAGNERRTEIKKNVTFEGFDVQVQDLDATSTTAATIGYTAEGYGEEL